MPDFTFLIEPDESTTRLDKLVAAKTKLSRAGVRRLFDEGQVLVGSRRASKGDLLPAGKEVKVTVPDAADDGPAVPEAHPATPLVLLLERPDLVVVDKPAGQPSAPLRGGETGTLANALVGRYPEMAGIGFAPREPGLVHRLDNDTSGVVVAARDRKTFDALTTGLRGGVLDKRYLAVVDDNDMPEEGTIEIPLAPHPKDRRRVLACLHPRDVQREKPRPALSEYRVLARAPGVALVEVSAPRALRHQIRAHLAAIGCPIVGDTLYGGSEREGLGRHALHAASVTWSGEGDVAAFDVRAPLPPELAALVPR